MCHVRLRRDCCGCAQAYANATGSAAAQEVGRAVTNLGSTGFGDGRPASVGGPKKDRDLAVFCGFQNSPTGLNEQAALTESSFDMADAVGGHTAGDGTLVSSVYDRLGDLCRRPGVWLLRAPFREETLADKPGALRALPVFLRDRVRFCMRVYACRTAGGVVDVLVTLYISAGRHPGPPNTAVHHLGPARLHRSPTYTAQPRLHLSVSGDT